MWESAAAIGLDLADEFLGDRLNKRSNRENRDWETYMYTHRYRTQVADLRAAGLNPMLAYGQGPGSVPTSSASSVQKGDMAGNFLASRANSAQVANVNADTVKKDAETKNIEMDTFLKLGMNEQIAAMTQSALASADQARAMAEQIRVTIPKIDEEIKKLQSEVEKNKSDVQVNESLIQAQAFKNQLLIAETVLTNRRSRSESQSITFNEPREKAYKDKSREKQATMQGSTGLAADIMENFWRIFNPLKGTKGK